MMRLLKGLFCLSFWAICGFTLRKYFYIGPLIISGALIQGNLKLLNRTVSPIREAYTTLDGTLTMVDELRAYAALSPRCVRSLDDFAVQANETKHALQNFLSWSDALLAMKTHLREEIVQLIVRQISREDEFSTSEWRRAPRLVVQHLVNSPPMARSTLRAKALLHLANAAYETAIDQCQTETSVLETVGKGHLLLSEDEGHQKLSNNTRCGMEKLLWEMIPPWEPVEIPRNLDLGAAVPARE